MKIAIISCYHIESSLCLAKYIAKQGCEVDYYYVDEFVHIISTPGIQIHNNRRSLGLSEFHENEIPEIIDYTNGLPIRFFRMGFFSFYPFMFWLNKIQINSSIRKIVKQQYDAIDIVGQSPQVSILHDKLKSQNLSHTIHEIGSHYDNVNKDSLINKIIEDGSKLILHSESLRARVVGQIEANKVKTIPFGKFETMLLYKNGSPLQLNIDTTYVTFLYYGYMLPYKGLDILKCADEILRKRGIKYNLIVAGYGNDPTIPYFHNTVNCYLLNRYLTSNEIIELHKLSDVVCMPYKSASQSGIIPTSFMLGCPVIGTNVGAISAVISDGRNGIIVEPNNPESFAEAMMEIIMSPDYLNNLKEGACKFGCGDNYDWKHIAYETLNFLITKNN